MVLYIICILFYLIGSFPTAYILVRLKHKKILTQEGTGNIGARNTYDVTNSKVLESIPLENLLLKQQCHQLWLLKYSELDPHLIFSLFNIFIAWSQLFRLAKV